MAINMSRLAELENKNVLERWERQELVQLRAQANLNHKIEENVSNLCRKLGVGRNECLTRTLRGVTYTVICRNINARRFHYIGVSHEDGRAYKLAQFD